MRRKFPMKGQLSVDFIVALIVFISLSFYLAFQILNIVPNYLQEVRLQEIRSEAFQISTLLVNDVGLPQNWHDLDDDDLDEIERIGLSGSLTRTNIVSIQKLDTLQEICSSDERDGLFKKWFATDLTISILVFDRTDGEILLDCIPVSPTSPVLVATASRIVSFTDGTYGEVVLQIW